MEKAADTPNILDSGMLIVNEHTKYQKKRERSEPNGKTKGAKATGETTAYPMTA